MRIDRAGEHFGQLKVISDNGNEMLLCECTCGRRQLFPRAVTKPTYRGRKCCDFCRGSDCVICGERIPQTTGRVAKTCCPEHARKYASEKEKKRYRTIRDTVGFAIKRAEYIGKLKQRYTLEPSLYLIHRIRHRQALNKYRGHKKIVNEPSQRSLTMSLVEKKEQKEAYLDALSTSPVEREVLRYLHKVSDNVLDKWLYVPDRYPTFRACYELWMFIRKQKRLMSKKLHRLIIRSQTRANEAFEKFGDDDRDRTDNTRNRYVYNGKRLTMKQIAGSIGVSVSAVSLHIKKSGLIPEDDVSHLNITSRNGPHTYIYQGKTLNKYQISKMLNISVATIQNRILTAEKKPGDDITDLDFNLKQRGRKKSVLNKLD